MKADERIEALLNRAGQTISDLPMNEYKTEQLEAVDEMVQKYFRYVCYTPDEDDYAEYILHLADIIDRMECALENTLLKLDDAR